VRGSRKLSSIVVGGDVGLRQRYTSTPRCVAVLVALGGVHVPVCERACVRVCVRRACVRACRMRPVPTQTTHAQALLLNVCTHARRYARTHAHVHMHHRCIISVTSHARRNASQHVRCAYGSKMEKQFPLSLISLSRFLSFSLRFAVCPPPSQTHLTRARVCIISRLLPTHKTLKCPSV
jgi:hypothetical protein